MFSASHYLLRCMKIGCLFLSRSGSPSDIIKHKGYHPFPRCACSPQLKCWKFKLQPRSRFSLFSLTDARFVSPCLCRLGAPCSEPPVSIIDTTLVWCHLGSTVFDRGLANYNKRSPGIGRAALTT